jgi:hypothetical protein
MRVDLSWIPEAYINERSTILDRPLQYADQLKNSVAERDKSEGVS